MDDVETKRELFRAGNEAINALRQILHSQEMSAVRSLQVVYAGGAVALLSFLGQTWSATSELRIALVITVGLMVVGLLLAVYAGFQLPAYSEQGFRQNESSAASDKYRGTRCWYLSTICLSFLAFISAVLTVILRVIYVSCV